jgi:hypothetical protein
MAKEMEVVALTKREVKSVSYDWEIENLSFFTEERSIESPTFTAGDQFQWKLEIVPKGHGDHHYHSQYWRLNILPLTAESITCRSSAVLVRSDGRVINKLSSLPWDTAKGKSQWKTSRWEKEDQFFKFDGDNLTVKVRIEYSPKTTASTTEVQRPIPP